MGFPLLSQLSSWLPSSFLFSVSCACSEHDLLYELFNNQTSFSLQLVALESYAKIIGWFGQNILTKAQPNF